MLIIKLYKIEKKFKYNLEIDNFKLSMHKSVFYVKPFKNFEKAYICRKSAPRREKHASKCFYDFMLGFIADLSRKMIIRNGEGIFRLCHQKYIGSIKGQV